MTKNLLQSLGDYGGRRGLFCIFVKAIINVCELEWPSIDKMEPKGVQYLKSWLVKRCYKSTAYQHIYRLRSTLGNVVILLYY